MRLWLVAGRPPHSLRLAFHPPGASLRAELGTRGFGPELRRGWNASGVGLQTGTEGTQAGPGDPGPLTGSRSSGPDCALTEMGRPARRPVHRSTLGLVARLQ